MNIFSVLNKANENIMEYYSPPQPMPMQPPMQQPMPMRPPMQPSMPAFGPSPMSMQKPIFMPTKSSVKKDDDTSFVDILKMLAAAGLIGGGGYMAYNQMKEPAWKSNAKDGASFVGRGVLDFAKHMAPGLAQNLQYKIDRADTVSRHMKRTKKDDKYKAIIDRGHRREIEQSLPGAPKWLIDNLHTGITQPNSMQRTVMTGLLSYLQPPQNQH